MMTWLPLMLAVAGIGAFYLSARSTTPIPTERLVEGELEAVEFFWRPG